MAVRADCLGTSPWRRVNGFRCTAVFWCNFGLHCCTAEFPFLQVCSTARVGGGNPEETSVKMESFLVRRTEWLIGCERESMGALSRHMVRLPWTETTQTPWRVLGRSSLNLEKNCAQYDPVISRAIRNVGSLIIEKLYSRFGDDISGFTSRARMMEAAVRGNWLHRLWHERHIVSIG